MTNIFKPKKIICLALSLVLCASALIISLNVKADMVTVSKTVNPQLEFAKIKADYITVDGGKKVFQDSDGSYEESGDESSRNYTIKTNSFACWYDGDQVDYAYLKIPFNYRADDEATLTAEVTINSWSAYAKTASAGLLLRSSLNARASFALAHARPEAMLMVSRTETGKFCNGNLNYKEPPKYDNGIRLRLTFATSGKGVGKVKSEYNFTPSNPNSWITIQSGVFVKFDKDIYIGLGASSADSTDLATAVFSDFSVEVTAYEGYELEDSEDDTSSSSSSSSSEVTLPPDIPPTEDVLLKETFTDGSMFYGEESVENPIWETTASETTVELNKDKTNRYLAITPVSDGLWYAGNTDWTDYSVSCDVTFPTDLSITNTNTFGLIGRLKFNKMHGISSYSAVLSSKTQTVVEKDDDGTEIKHTKIIQTLTLGANNMQINPSTPYSVALKTVTLNYLDAEDPDAYDLVLSGKKHNLRMDMLDNTVKIYWDDEEVISYVDDTGRLDIPAYGNIGLFASNVTVNVDNVTVRKLEDPLGGDFDNFISGRWNEPISKELYQYYIDNKISFY